MQASGEQSTAAENLSKVVIGKPYEVYERFVEAVKHSKRKDVLEMLGVEGWYDICTLFRI